MKLILGFAMMEFKASSMYTVHFWMGIFGNLVGMYGAYWLWTTLYTQEAGIFPITLEQIITYGMLAMILNSVFDAASEVNWYITGRIRSGSLQMDLLRPIDFPSFLLTRSAGQFLYTSVTLGLPGLFAAMLFLGLRPPASPLHGLLFLISLAPAFLVSFSLYFLLGMISIYTIEASQIQWVYFSVIQLLSGQFVPLWVFPAPVAQIIGLLPFQCIIGIPLSIYIGQIPIVQTGNFLVLQIFWATALLLFCRLVWQNARTKLTVQGG